MSDADVFCVHLCGSIVQLPTAEQQQQSAGGGGGLGGMLSKCTIM